MAVIDTKSLVRNVAEATGISEKDTGTLISALAALMRERCPQGDSIAVPGFGTFEPRKRAERLNVHPSTGKRMLLPPKITLSFKQSQLLKQRLNPSD